MIRFDPRHLVLAAFSLFLLTACESTEPIAGETRILLSQGSVSGTQALAASLLPHVSVSAAQGPVSTAQVASIEVNVTGIDALPQGASENDQGRWISLQVTAPATLNLLALPTTPENGLLLARGDLPEGTYGGLRVRFTTAFVTFNQEIQVGQVTYPANEQIALFVPSGAQTGIKVPQSSFTVGEGAGAEVSLVFDPDASLATIVATGANTVILVPVLGVRR